MRGTGWLSAVAVIAVAAAGCVPPGRIGYEADFYVSPNGSDLWSGRLATPNASGTDGPFATLQQARDALRGLTAPRHPRLGRFVILVRGGTYYLQEPIVFRPEDSGSQDTPVVYAAYPNESPVFSGARPVTGWREGDGDVWTARLPEFVPVPSGSRPTATSQRRWLFHQLWVRDRRRPRARAPNDGYLHIDAPLPQFDPPQEHRDSVEARSAFRYREGDLQRWPDLDRVNLVAFHAWTASRHWVRAVEEDQRIVRLTAPASWPFGYWKPDQRYYVENCRAALDAPGEWYFEPKTRTLHYRPMAGEAMHGHVAHVPVLDELVVFDGEPAAGRFVHHITLRGLSFRHAGWRLARDKPAEGQAAAFLDSAAVLARGTHHCSIAYCEIGHVGTYGLWLAGGCQDNRVVHCHVHDLGAGGIRIGETRSARHGALATERNVVDNCYVHDGGHVFPSGVGIWVGRGSHNQVTHCEVADLNYTGVSVGWTWGYTPSAANHNVIEHNHIHHIGRGVLSDLGGVYTLGVSPGTRVRHNRIHDVHAHDYGGWGLYADEGSSQILFESNLVYNTTHGGFHLNYGRDNVVRNNIFALSRHAQIVRSRPEPHHALTFSRNIVYCDRDAVLGGAWRRGAFTFDYNLYWVTTGAPPDFAGRSFGQWRAAGQDEHSLVAAPGFRNPAAYDFHVGFSSPARRVGFNPWDATEAGLCGEDYWVAASRHKERVALPPAVPRRSRTVADDFETTPVGQRPARGTVTGAGRGASVQVSDDAAATGTRSLKVLDAPGLDKPWHPQLHYTPRHSEGTVRLAFDLRVEPGAELWHEWRTQGEYYQAGPSIRFGPKGQVVAGGKLLGSVPVGRWVHVEIVCRLGQGATGQYDVTVSVPGHTQRFDGVPCAAPGFGRLQWLGFMSMASARSVWYLDNVRLDRLP
ncbi:MAG: right-handed parallel beta-helix repeat-containing protein [Planctomycetota bacterium]